MADNTHWNYRVLATKNNYGTWFGVHEVFYRDKKPFMYSENSVAMRGETAKELQDDYSRMAEAFKLPVLTDEDFPKRNYEPESK